MDGSGDIPFVTASGINNGVVAHIDGANYDIIEGNCILVGGKTFTLTYQKDNFVSNDSHNIILYGKDCGDEQVLLFVITVLKCSLQSKYHWGDAVTKDKLLAETIKLPANSKGLPDWACMKNYMHYIQRRVAASPILQ